MIEEETGEPALQDIPFEPPDETEEDPVTPPASELQTTDSLMSSLMTK